VGRASYAEVRRSARCGDALEVQPKDGLNETKVIPGLQFFEVDDTDLPIAAFGSMSWRHDDALRKLDGLVTECRNARVVLIDLGDAIPLRPQVIVALSRASLAVELDISGSTAP
jgi:hypothetical protein